MTNIIYKGLEGYLAVLWQSTIHGVGFEVSWDGEAWEEFDPKNADMVKHYIDLAMGMDSNILIFRVAERFVNQYDPIPRLRKIDSFRACNRRGEYNNPRAWLGSSE